MKPSFLLMTGLTLSAIIGVSGIANAASGGNLLPNGDFEKGLGEWMLSHGPAPDVYKLTDKAGAFKGEHAVSMKIDAGSPENIRQYSYWARTDLPIEPGYYRFSFAARQALDTGTLGAYIFAQGEGDRNLLVLSPGQLGTPLLSGTSDWKEYSFVYRVPKNAKKSILQFQLNKAIGTAWLDEVKIEKLDDVVGKRLMSQQAKEAQNHEDAGAKLMGQPCRNANALKGLLHVDPKTGHELLIINSCTTGDRGAAIFIDLETGESTVTQLPAGGGGWDIIEATKDILLFESLEPLHLISIDLNTRQLIENGDVPVPQTAYAWRFVKGPDGSIYFGSHGAAHAFRFNPTTREVEDLGRMGPEGNTYNRFVGLTGDGWLLSSVMMEKSGIVAYNLATKQQQMVEGITDAPDLMTIGGTVYTQVGGVLKQFDSASMKFIDVKIPAPEGAKWTGVLASSTPQRLLFWANDGACYLVEEGKAARKIWDLNLRGGALVGLDRKGRVIGKRGQDYFIAEPLAKEIAPRQITQEAPPGAMHFIRADPEGGITGGPSFGQTLFRFDPARNLQQNTGQVVDGAGEVYDGRWIDGKFYFVAYSGGDLAVWDPKAPWDQWNGKNPRPLVAYNTPQHHSLIRPQGGLVIGPQGRLYAGWSVTYGTATGGFTEYDIKTNKARSWSSDLITPEMSIGSVAADERYVYGVTSNHFNGLTRPVKPIVFWVFDPATEQIVYKKTLDAATVTPVVQHIPGTNNIWLFSSLGMFRFDREKFQFADTVAWPTGITNAQGINSHDSHGSRAWFAADNTVIELRDGKKPSAKAWFTAPVGIQTLTAGKDRLYYTQLTEVWSAPLTKE